MNAKPIQRQKNRQTDKQTNRQTETRTQTRHKQASKLNNANTTLNLLAAVCWHGAVWLVCGAHGRPEEASVNGEIEALSVSYLRAVNNALCLSRSLCLCMCVSFCGLFLARSSQKLSFIGILAAQWRPVRKRTLSLTNSSVYLSRSFLHLVPCERIVTET
jgi:hypothetical protein